MTSVSVADCEKVLDAFEEVLGGELNRKGWKNGIPVSASGWKGQLYGPEYSLSGCAAHSAGGERG